MPDLEYRELHQIVRELTNGIYGGNQMPSLCLEPNFDRSSTCQIPVVYKDTRVGQILVAVDYAMKSFWHGVSVPTKKRSKLSERWRALLDVNTATGEYSKHKNPISEFTAAGQEYVTSDPTFVDLYESLKKVDPDECSAEKENRFFNTYSEFVKCVLSVHMSRVCVSPIANVLALHATCDISSAVTLSDHNHIHPMSLQRWRRRLRHHVNDVKPML
uniref:Ankyrin and armadillo repeat-containing protein n=1 Tax=Phallusia mammillata TaxID=59560 RepID=A0A6F9D5T4_9ASCI|nr:ankyrin and armadillo repeat-containing protein [Phallusia mammillata]